MLSQQANMMQFVVVAGIARASGQAAITYRLGAITLFAQMLTYTQRNTVRELQRLFPHLHLAPPA